MPSIRLVIAHPHAAIRAGIDAALTGHRFMVVGEAATTREVVDVVTRERPAVCLLDGQIGGGGIEATRQISERAPEVAVVLLSHGDTGDLLAALRAGAMGFLSADQGIGRLPETLRAVAAGEAVVPRRLVGRLVDELRSNGRRRRVALQGSGTVEVTGRELETIELIREGLTTAQVAQRLHVSPVTVRRHLSSVARKVGAPDRETAVELLASL